MSKAINLKNLREYFNVDTLHETFLKEERVGKAYNSDTTNITVDSKVLMIYDKTYGSGSFLTHKYFCCLLKEGRGYRVLLDNRAKKYSELKEYPVRVDTFSIKCDVDDYLSKIKHDCEFYNPMVAEDIFVHFNIIRFLNSIGFKDMNSGMFQYTQRDIYGKPSHLELYITGLGKYDGFGDIRDVVKDNVVTIRYVVNDATYTSTTCEREIDVIKSNIAKLVNPILLTNGLKSLEAAELIPVPVDEFEFNITLNQLRQDYRVATVEFKAELKRRLLEFADGL